MQTRAWLQLLPALAALALCPAPAAALPTRATAVAAKAPVTTPPDAEKERRLAEFLHGQEVSVRRVLSHLRAEGSLDKAEAASLANVTTQLEAALAVHEVSMGHALALHKALVAAHFFLLHRTKALTERHNEILRNISDDTAAEAWSMLKQRRRLPLASQLAVLRRRQFKDCTYAKQLLAHYNATVPLYQQLAALLPPSLAHRVTASKPKVHEHLAAAGSEGRVHIVTSTLYNDVRSMEREMAEARARIAAILKSPAAMSEAERRQSQKILSGLDEMLARTSKTKDLKTRLDAMYEMEGKIKSWMSSLAL